VFFQNKAALRLDKTLQNDCSATLFEIKKLQFAPLDLEKLKR